MMRLKFFLCAVLAGIAMTGLAPAARASFMIEYSINGAAYSEANVVTGGTGTLGSPYYADVFIGNLTILATGGGTTTTSVSTLDLSVGGTENASTKIQILVSMTGVETAPPPESLQTSMGAGILSGSLGQTPGAKLTMAEYLAASNTLFDTTTAVVGPQTIPASTTITNTATVNLTPNYSWTASMTIDNSSNSYTTNNMSLTNDGTLTALPAPAPGGLVLLASAAPVLLAGTWWRRRNAQPAC